GAKAGVVVQKQVAVGAANPTGRPWLSGRDVRFIKPFDRLASVAATSACILCAPMVSWAVGSSMLWAVAPRGRMTAIDSRQARKKTGLKSPVDRNDLCIVINVGTKQ